MAFHIVLPRQLTPAESAAWSVSDERPRVAVAMLARELGATIHSPDDAPATLADRLRAKVAGPPSSWAMARRIAAQVSSADVVFCSSEAGGLHAAEACGSLRNRPKLCMFVHNLDRPRGRLALKLFKAAERVDLFLACSNAQVEFLRDYLSLPESRVKFVWDHTDTSFFCPGPALVAKPRPLVLSVGLEKRDYITLAAATSDLNVDVKISGFSADAAAMTETFPSPLPANMDLRFYSWQELVQLYRAADVVVVSVHENRYAAGVQSLMEAMACGAPVVVTCSFGLKDYISRDCAVSVPPNDQGAMGKAISTALKDADAARERGVCGAHLARQRHGIERYVANLSMHLQSLNNNQCAA